jgi:hypothetical protein
MVSTLPSLTRLALGVLALLVCAAPATAQPWEYSPYTIRAWLSWVPSGEWDSTVENELVATLRNRSDIEIGAPWTLVVESPPEQLRSSVGQFIDRITVDDVAAAAETALTDDKIMLLSLSANSREYVVRARELDCRTRSWGPTIERRLRNPSMLGSTAFRAMVAAFAPVTRIESGSGKTAIVRLRGGGLILENNSPVYVAEGDVLLPVIRNNDRYGKPIPGKIDEVPWTLLQVTGRTRANTNVLDCNVHSGMRSPIRGRVSARKERYALGVRVTDDQTQLVIHGKTRSRDAPPIPLAGLEVYSKIPAVEPPKEQTAEEARAAERSNPPEFMGYTDWRGALTIDAPEGPLRVLYIKNGGQLLARLPMVPGFRDVQIAEVPDDNPRLQAEGYIKGLSGEIMDLVAQRQIIAARIRKRIEEGNLDEAEGLLEEFRALPSRNDMQRLLDQQMARQVPSNYMSVQARIDKLYGETRGMLGKYLDPNLGNKLMQELRLARRGEEASPADPEAGNQAQRPSPTTGESPAPMRR